MRRYITEKVGILECFQIIVAIVALTLGYYAFGQDVVWNNIVDEHGINACIHINQKIVQKNMTILLESECHDRLDIIHEESCRKYLQDNYLTEQNRTEGTTIQFGTRSKNLKQFLRNNMRRSQASETTFLVVMHLISILLICHLILASIFHAVDLRTKWNAAFQGIVLFGCGFSAMLLAISVNAIDSKYITVSNQLLNCGMLRFCDRSVTAHPELPIDTEVLINDVLSKFDACQDVKVKQSICILLIILIGTCCAMILLAMDLTTKYEQETEEQEIIQKQAAENLDNLDDEVVNFEIESHSQPEIQTLPQVVGSASGGFHPVKSGSTVIAEYLAVNRPH